MRNHLVQGETTLRNRLDEVHAEAGITVENVTVVRGGHTALSNVSFSVGAGTLLGVLGPNGAGKSSLFGAIAGTLPLARGTVNLHGLAALDERTCVCSAA